MRDLLTARLQKAKSVCTTADIWSANHKSYFGVTAHWIEEETLQRQSAALACSRMTGKHTYLAIASKLDSVHTAYHINDKVCLTVTDNGSNFVKAFAEFGDDDRAKDDPTTQSQLVVQNADDELSFVDVHEILSGECDAFEADELAYSLPCHQRCASHTLNLVAVNDSKHAETDTVYKRLFRCTTAKCTALWNKASRSTQAADVVREKLNTCLIMPNATRWNSYYNAMDKVRVIIEQSSRDVVRDVFSALDVAMLKPDEILLLNEYCKVMQPLACALDILQSETKCYMGILLPTLVSLKTKLASVKLSLKYCAPLADALLQGVDTRFQGYMDRPDLMLASLTMPQFRLRWLPDEAARQTAKLLLCSDVAQLQSRSEQISSQTQPEHAGAVAADNSAGQSNSMEEHFFDFEMQQPVNTDASIQVELYLTDPSQELACLDKVPLIRQLFIKYNTPLPSSAPVERLFSLGGQILTPRRNRLGDENFERQVLLRANSFILKP